MTAITMTAAELAEYRAIRAPRFGQLPPSPEQARIDARAKCAPASGPEWKEQRRGNGYNATETRDGFVLAYNVTESGEWADWSDLGTTTDERAPGHYDRRHIAGGGFGYRHTASDYRYIVLAKGSSDYPTIYKYGIGAKYGKARAADAALVQSRDELRVIEMYLSGKIASLIVSVTVKRAGIELAHESCWTDAEIDDLAHFSELAEDMAEEAIDAARAKLAELCAA